MPFTRRVGLCELKIILSHRVYFTATRNSIICITYICTQHLHPNLSSVMGTGTSGTCQHLHLGITYHLQHNICMYNCLHVVTSAHNIWHMQSSAPELMYLHHNICTQHLHYSQSAHNICTHGSAGSTWWSHHTSLHTTSATQHRCTRNLSSASQHLHTTSAAQHLFTQHLAQPNILHYNICTQHRAHNICTRRVMHLHPNLLHCCSPNLSSCTRTYRSAHNICTRCDSSTTRRVVVVHWCEIGSFPLLI